MGAVEMAEGRQPSREVARLIGVTANRLRQYSVAMEAAAGSTTIFPRNKQNARCYSAQQIHQIQAIHALVADGQSIAAAVAQAGTDVKLPAENSDTAAEISRLQAQVAAQQRTITQLKDTVAQVMAQNARILDTLQPDAGVSPTAPAPATAAQSAMPSASLAKPAHQDQVKSYVTPSTHEDGVEHNAHPKTLADMQLAPVAQAKNHWWRRFKTQ